MRLMRLTKYHGAGNDFLVALDGDRLGPPGADPERAELARRVCDRHRGVGADGLILARPAADGADVSMELRNCDGSRAELSGNGLLCLARSLVDAGRVRGDTVVVSTDAGRRVVRRLDEDRFAVDMGVVRVVRADPRLVEGTVEAAAVVDAGNPHLVLLDSATATVDVTEAGPRVEALFSEAINIEWVWPSPGPAAGSGHLDLRVWERGAGATLACGSGSCAAAVAAHQWGRVPRRVTVHNPGGDLEVEIGETVVLSGVVVRVATVELA